MKLDIIFAVEDPGAANFILGMPDELKKYELTSEIISFGYAQRFLSERNIKNIKFDDNEGLEMILEKFEFKVLIAGTQQNPDSQILSLINLCRTNNILTIGIIDMMADFHLRFKGNTNEPLYYAPEYLVVPDTFTMKAFVNLGFKKSNIYELMHPSLQRIKNRADKYPQEKIINKRISLLRNKTKNTEIWLFAGEPIFDDNRFMKDDKYTISGRGKSKIRIHIILEEVLEIRNRRKIKPFLILRMHPKNKLNDYSDYFNEIDMFSNDVDPLEDILCSDLILGSSTIFLMEAFYAGRSTLSIIPKRGEEEWCPSVLQGLTPCAHTTDQIESEINKYKYKSIKKTKIPKNNNIGSIVESLLSS